MNVKDLLEQVKNGTIEIEEAEKHLRKQPYEEMGYAKLDSHREIRSGFPEVVYCSGKPDEFLASIYQKLYDENGEVFGTRASEHQYEIVKQVLPQVVYDPISHILKIEKEDKEHIGKIAICSAGTADIPVAEEAAQTAEFFGANVERIYDVGVSGVHRLLAQLDTVQEANCVGSGWHGRRTGKRSWRTGEQSGDRSADFGRLWCEYARIIGASYYDQFLCKWNCCGKY